MGDAIPGMWYRNYPAVSDLPRRSSVEIGSGPGVLHPDRDDSPRQISESSSVKTFHSPHRTPGSTSPKPPNDNLDGSAKILNLL